MPALLSLQVEGAKFLAAREAALLADAPGVGKTAQAIAAADYIFARRILVVTTASARANWLKEFQMWSAFDRSTVAVYTTRERIPDVDVVVVAWSNVIAEEIRDQLAKRIWDLVIFDESHRAKSLETRATAVAFGVLRPRAVVVWCLSGTPVPNSPADLYPMMRHLFPQALGGMNYDAFLKRYCVTRKKSIGWKTIDVVIGGRNQDELNQRLAPYFLRRQADDLPPMRFATYSVRPNLSLADALSAEQRLDAEMILAAAETGDTKTLELHLGPLRRLTGTMKARAVVELMKDELEDGLAKVVLFYWHKDVGRILRDGLSQYGVVGIDGSTPADIRQSQVDSFQRDPDARVFLAQIVAAGEAITLTAANQCLFVEVSLVPKDMAQAVRRISRRGQTRPCLCRVVALSGSIDEALMEIVTRKVETISKVLGDI